jgi:hypothetical protein
MQINTILSPPIKQFFDPYMLDSLLGMYKRVENEIIPLSRKKIRDQDVGKIKEFSELLEKFQELYERKKTEKAEYDEKIKNAAKRSSLPSTGQTARFTRFQRPQQIT